MIIKLLQFIIIGMRNGLADKEEGGGGEGKKKEEEEGEDSDCFPPKLPPLI